MQKKFDIFDYIRSKPILSLLTGGAIIVFGVLISDIPKMVISQGWPSTDGTILYHKFWGQKEKQLDGSYYTNTEVYIRYQYTVNDISYSSLTINSIHNIFNRYPASYASRYPVGTDVIVYYNPKSPSKAVLEPGFVNVGQAFDVICYLVFGFGIYFIHVGISQIKENRYRKRRQIPG